MLRWFGRLFLIKTRFEALAVIYALGLGAAERGFHYVDRYPGIFGYLLFAACTGTVFMAGAKILDAVPAKAAKPKPHDGQERRAEDRRAQDRRIGDRRQGSPARPA